ncbi:hypothetical protein NE236_20795 [Actinoallomurus purpureus]|uniref:hypothetical protein n=1 Tax=Actinoallomurus purpureus TaxID=478114 RepID=UPI002093D052|nr:hypothetical protein [Actinoallomurus purpureus]MCO6007421.1 hypothetical protein [Actinoallomurus purpureus]
MSAGAAALVGFTAALLGLLPATATAAPQTAEPAPGTAIAAPLTSASGAASPTSAPTAGTPTAGTGSKTRGRVLLIGVPGLRWDDIRRTGTPNLWNLTGQAAVGSLSVKTVAGHTCPIDGWLTISAGQRAQLRNGGCGLPPAPTTGTTTVPGFPGLREDNAHNKYGSKLGLLGDAVHRAGGCTMAIGPGAAVGVADGTGRVDGYAPSVDKAPADAWSRCALTVVDVDDVVRASVNAGVDVDGRQVRVTSKDRAAAASAADAQVGRILRSAPAGTTVLLAGLSDNTHTSRLHVAMATGPGYGPRYLTANSTRTGGLVTLTDVTSTILHTLGVAQPKDAVGSPWRLDGRKSASVSRVVRALKDRDAAAQAYGRFVFPFYLALIAVQIALYAFATVALRRKAHRLLAATKVVALAAGALPVASFLANAVPWWASGQPALMLTVLILLGVAVITAAAAAGPWRRSVTGPGAVVAGATALFLALDVMTGNHLQTCSVLGYTPVVAGRFYGFGNTTWALWITGVIIAAGALAGRLIARRGDRRLAPVALVVGAGLAALVVDGAPMWGADFGGLIATFPGFAVFAFMLSGRRARPTRVIAVLAAGAVLILGVSFLDSLRANPTHIGEFWNSLTSGDAGTVIFRKFRGMIGTFGNWKLSVIAVAAIGFLFFALLRPLAWRAAALHMAYERAPALRATLASVLVTSVVGMLVNDSGVAIPAMAFTIAVPLALAASVRALELGASERPPRPERSEEPSAHKG